MDPTTVAFPGPLTGIVGPNGCGKSNVIDAVRWVMGESSAKNLRGDSMTDVIFNGSTTRKPVGLASIELLFDNSDGTIQGQYAQYNEIGIRRQVTRDGQSQYYLNGTRCRRKDITDIFLGTGLGPRSYAIIEQGTISRLIEARPEELRVFIEEAAGISKYKERRRETENRIKHTRENLDRVYDLTEEVGKQLRHLERQAKTAEKYQEFKQQERLKQAQHDALRWRQLDGELGEENRKVQALETELQEANSQKYHFEAKLENLREEHIAANDAFNDTQGEYYRVGAEIARVEQTLQHSRERRQQVQQDLREVQEQLSQTRGELQSDELRSQALQIELEELENQRDEARETEQHAASSLAQWEDRMQAWQQDWELFNQQATEPNQTAQVEKTRIAQLESQLMQLHQRSEGLTEELHALNTHAIEQAIDELQQANSEHEQQQQTLQEQRQQVQEQIRDIRETIKNGGHQLNALRGRGENLAGRLASLEALQQDALHLEEQHVAAWLDERQLQQAPRLAQVLEVQPGWEQAVECVLGSYLEAVCVEDMLQLVPGLDDIGAAMSLFHAQENTVQFPPGDSLLGKIKAPYELRSLLSNVYVADDLRQAMEKFSQLGSGSVVTPSGIWIGPGWVRVNAAVDEDKSVLARERRIKDIQNELQPLHEQIHLLQEDMDAKQEALESCEQTAAGQQDQWENLRRQMTRIQTDISAGNARLENARERQEKIQHELDDNHTTASGLDEDIKNAYARLNDALTIMEEHTHRRDELSVQRENIGENLSRCREENKQAAADSHAFALRFESIKANLASNVQAVRRLRDQLQHMEKRAEDLDDVAARSHTPEQELNAELEQLLQQRLQAEAELGVKRTSVDALEEQLRTTSQNIHDSEQRTMERRDQLDQLRLHWQELTVRRQTVLEQLQEHGHVLDEVVASLPEPADAQVWHDELEQLRNRISRLGPINLAAIDEFAQQNERKQYLDAQIADLQEALETLERAIKKIDKETRERFKETFEKVNAGISELFPRLFGGGSAYMEMTGEDLLDCGVSVMARPPGKRNSTIHLLSGGEKALTAVAMVFSIFNLNPAPFCMLDEVDAPLDDANVGRFCAMVKEMSDRVQFIVITHNKITMEMSTQLTGVTMHEPGVSRLVAVDVEEAVELAAV